MLEKNKIRMLILEQLTTSTSETEVLSSLDKLTVLGSNGYITMEPFFEDLNNIISWDELNSVQFPVHEIVTNQVMGKLVAVAGWCLRSWQGVGESGDLSKAIVSFIVAERIFLQPEIDFTWSFSVVKLRLVLTKILSTVKLDISDEIPESSGYNDKKVRRDYKAAIDSQNYWGILYFLNSVHGFEGNWESATEFVKVLMRISAQIDVQLIASNLDFYSPMLVKVIIKCLNQNQVEMLMSSYMGQSTLVLLLGLGELIASENKTTEKHDLEMKAQTFSVCAKILNNLSKNVATESLFVFVSETLNVAMSKGWHVIYSYFLTLHSGLIDDYAHNVDFSSSFGEDVYFVFEHFGDEPNLNEFAEAIYGCLVSYLERLDYQHHLFFFTSYYRFIFHGIQSKVGNSFVHYQRKLEIVSVDLLRGIYSWNPKSIYMLFTFWIYWVLSAKLIIRDSLLESALLVHTYRLLKDTRVQNILETNRNGVNITFQRLGDFIDDPDSVEEIELPLFNGSTKLKWFKK